jgi:ribose transport system substrate-binding protein
MNNGSFLRIRRRSLLAGGLGIALAAGLSAVPAMAAESGFANFSKKDLVIGVANGYIGNNWRTQMINDVQEAAKPYKAAGIVKQVIIANANNNLSQQISQIHDMISKGVDAIIIDAVSPTAIAPIIKDAVARKILVIGTDNGLVSDDVVNVVPDSATWARISADWVFQKMGGKGNLLVVNGLAGQAVDTIRWGAVKDLLDKNYPKIKVLQQVYGQWDEAAAKQAVSRVLSSYSQIDGVWTQDGMAIGTIQAFQAANRKLPVVATDDNVAYLRLWSKLKKEGGFSTIAVANPPGIAATAFKVAIRMLEGRKIKQDLLGANPLKPSQHNTVLIKPKLVVTDENLESVIQSYAGKPDTYYLDRVLSEDEVDRLFAE